MFVRECGVEEIGDRVVEYRIAQEFKALVVDPSPVRGLYRLGTVYHRQFVELDVSWIVARDAMNKNIKLLILDEKELYA